MLIVTMDFADSSHKEEKGPRYLQHKLCFEVKRIAAKKMFRFGCNIFFFSDTIRNYLVKCDSQITRMKRGVIHK